MKMKTFIVFDTL